MVRKHKNSLLLIVTFVVTITTVAVMWPGPQTWIRQGLDLQGGLSLTLSVDEAVSDPVTEDDMRAVQSAVEQTLKENGIADASVQRQGTTAFLIQVPQMDSAEEVYELQTALEESEASIAIRVSSSRIVGPALGQQSSRNILVVISIATVIITGMLLALYRELGLLHIMFLLVFAVIYAGTLAIMSKLGNYVLTLSGVSAMVLVLGTTTNSSVLLFEGFKEALSEKRTPAQAMQVNLYKVRMVITDASIVLAFPAVAFAFFAKGALVNFGLTLLVGVVCDYFLFFFLQQPALTIFSQHPPRRYTKEKKVSPPPALLAKEPDDLSDAGQVQEDRGETHV